MWRGVEYYLLVAALVVSALAHGVLGGKRSREDPDDYVSFVGILHSPRKNNEYVLGALITPRVLFGATDTYLCKNRASRHLQETYSVHAGDLIVHGDMSDSHDDTRLQSLQQRKIMTLTVMELPPANPTDIVGETTYCRIMAVTYEPFEINDDVNTIPVLQNIRLWPKDYEEECRVLSLRAVRLSMNMIYSHRISPVPTKYCDVKEKVEGYDLCVTQDDAKFMCFSLDGVVVCQNALAAFYGRFFKHSFCLQGERNLHRLLSTFDDVIEWIYSTSCPELLEPVDFPMPKSASTGETLSVPAAITPVLIFLAVMVTSFA